MQEQAFKQKLLGKASKVNSSCPEGAPLISSNTCYDQREGEFTLP